MIGLLGVWWRDLGPSGTTRIFPLDIQKESDFKTYLAKTQPVRSDSKHRQVKNFMKLFDLVKD